MIKILALGNSFSQDATAYLHDMALDGGMETKVANLVIGGCSLRTHWENVVDNAANYTYECNGADCERKAAFKEVLLEDDWDVVTLQQASYDSGITESYLPFIVHLSGYIRKYSNAKLFIHQTWAYETDCLLDGFAHYGNHQEVMYNALKTAYENASRLIGADIIPCGDVIQALRGTRPFDYANGGKSLCCDGFHMEKVYGRYALAATWYMTILGKNITGNRFLPPGAVSAELINTIQQIVCSICSRAPIPVKAVSV